LFTRGGVVSSPGGPQSDGIRPPDAKADPPFIRDPVIR
jgi:hypothetical protein